MSKHGLPRSLKFVLIGIGACLLGVFLYWGKCQLGVDLIKGFAWEDHFTLLNSLQKQQYTTKPHSGVLLSSSFDELFPYRPWGNLWAREKLLVLHDVVPGGLKGSRCLRVESTSAFDWAMYQSHTYEVVPGERFKFEGYGRSDGMAAGMSVLFYDAGHTVINWGFARQKIEGTGWARYEREFTVPTGVAYVRFQLTGKGAGETYFDEVRFEKI